MFFYFLLLFDKITLLSYNNLQGKIVMDDLENTYIFFAKRIQKALDNDDVDELALCAEVVDMRRIYFVEEDEETGKRIVKPVFVYAAEHAGIDSLTFLLNQSCDVNIKDTFGNTALLVAVSNERMDIVDFLLRQQGVDTLIQNAFGEDIHSLAQLNGDVKMQERLQKIVPTPVNSESTGFCVNPVYVESQFKN